MKTLSGRCKSSKSISLSKATKILSKFVSADNGASQVINAYLHRASDAFIELNQLHRELKPSQSIRAKSRSHATDDSGKVGGSSVTSVGVKSENRTKREKFCGENDNVDEKSTENDVKLGREINGSVVGRSEKHSKKDKKKKNEFGDKEDDGKLPKKEQNENELGQGDEGMEEGKKLKKEKKKKDKNLEGENAKGREQQKEIETQISNNGKVAARVKNEIELSQGGEGGTEEGKKQKKEKKKKKKKKKKEKNLEGESAEEQKQQKDIEKKMSNNVKVENGGLVVPQDLEIRSKKRYEAGSENKLHAEEIKTEQRKKKRKSEDAEDRSEEQSKKKMKRKHESQALI